MVSLGALWLPILLAAVLVFIASSVIHMLLKYHNTEFKQLPNEDAARAALRGAPPGMYMTPYCANMKDLEKPDVKQKFQEGPVGMLILKAPGQMSMGPALIQWFVFCIVVGLFAAYVGSRTMDPGTAYMQVFRITGTVAFMGYGLSEVAGSIWMGKPWSSTAKSLFDALIYGLITGGTFGWRWPDMAM